MRTWLDPTKPGAHPTQPVEIPRPTHRRVQGGAQGGAQGLGYNSSAKGGSALPQGHPMPPLASLAFSSDAVRTGCRLFFPCSGEETETQKEDISSQPPSQETKGKTLHPGHQHKKPSAACSGLESRRLLDLCPLFATAQPSFDSSGAPELQQSHKKPRRLDTSARHHRSGAVTPSQTLLCPGSLSLEGHSLLLPGG